jgi:uncharacterized membrane protein
MILALRRHRDDAQAPSRLARAFHGMLAVMSLIVTAATFAMLAWLYGASSPPVLGAFAVGLAGAQVLAATFTRSMPWRLSSILQAAALVTIAVPLFLDQFAVTLAWLALAMVLAVLAWRLNLAAVRAWSVVLLLLAVARLIAFDHFDPALRAAQFTIMGQEITRWLLLGWSIAVLFHVVAWLKPRHREASRLLDAWIPPVASNRISRALDYATSGRAITTLDRIHPGGAVLAVIGTLLFAAVTGLKWNGPMLTLAMIAWLAPIALLARAGRNIGYGPHAAALALLVSARWIIFDNLEPLIDTWKRGQSLPPIVNLPALCGALLAGAVLLVCWDEKLLGLPPPREAQREPSRSSQLSPRLFAIIFAALISFGLLNFEIWRAIDWLDATGRIAIADRAIVKQVSMSVLWAIVGFAGVVFGFRRDIPAIRWAALALLAITLAKILVIDMSEVKAIWRILSFVAVGALLLAVSFVYHRQTQAQPQESERSSS